MMLFFQKKDPKSNLKADIISGQMYSGVDWGYKASAAIGFIKATKKLFKKPRNPLKILNFSEKVFKNNGKPYKIPPISKQKPPFLWQCLQKASFTL
jgi:hypothetical protein